MTKDKNDSSKKLDAEMTKDKNELITKLIIGQIILVLGAYLYFIGWDYIYYFYANFGISLTIIDIPLYYIFVFSSNIIFTWESLILIIIFIIFIYFFSVKYSNKWIIIIALVILFPILDYISFRIAKDDANQIKNGKTHRINFYLKNENNYPDEFINANEKGELLIITQTKEKYYVFHKPSDNISSREPSDEADSKELSDDTTSKEPSDENESKLFSGEKDKKRNSDIVYEISKSDILMTMITPEGILKRTRPPKKKPIK